jgi:hypothetical protein
MELRKVHFYLGIFFAPLIILFALSGALQTFRLQDTPKDGSYTPPAWIVKLADIHRDQRPVHDKSVSRSRTLEWFVAIMSAGLILSSVLGIYMAFKYRYDKRLICGLIVAGAAIPIVLLYL